MANSPVKSKSSPRKASPSKGKSSPSKGKSSPSKGKSSPSKGKSSPSKGKSSPSKGKSSPSKARVGQKRNRSPSPVKQFKRVVAGVMAANNTLGFKKADWRGNVYSSVLAKDGSYVFKLQPNQSIPSPTKLARAARSKKSPEYKKAVAACKSNPGFMKNQTGAGNTPGAVGKCPADYFGLSRGVTWKGEQYKVQRYGNPAEYKYRYVEKAKYLSQLEKAKSEGPAALRRFNKSYGRPTKSPTKSTSKKSPTKSASKKSTSKKSPSKKSPKKTPKKTASKKVSAKKASPKKTASKKVSAKKVLPKTAPKKTSGRKLAGGVAKKSRSSK